ncbi:hypothetical protein DRJ17_04905 [Candidatus Woesearchaeota archaeon]|nr:MAG: hypothetical protein DRJ17_04905 [Candidatus Woesearchaeota archaeon]
MNKVGKQYILMANKYDGMRWKMMVVFVVALLIVGVAAGVADGNEIGNLLNRFTGLSGLAYFLPGDAFKAWQEDVDRLLQKSFLLAGTEYQVAKICKKKISPPPGVSIHTSSSHADYGDIIFQRTSYWHGKKSKVAVPIYCSETANCTSVVNKHLQGKVDPEDVSCRPQSIGSNIGVCFLKKPNNVVEPLLVQKWRYTIEYNVYIEDNSEIAFNIDLKSRNGRVVSLWKDKYPIRIWTKPVETNDAGEVISPPSYCKYCEYGPNARIMDLFTEYTQICLRVISGGGLGWSGEMCVPITKEGERPLRVGEEPAGYSSTTAPVTEQVLPQYEPPQATDFEDFDEGSVGEVATGPGTYTTPSPYPVPSVLE